MVVPGVSTLVYQPQAKVYIATKNGMIDVSKDIVQVGVRRVDNGISSMTLSLNNKANRYTGRLEVNDRIVVFMKRLDNFLQVFAGYLDSVPVFSLYPTTADISASCTLKRLRKTYYDPGLQSTVDLLNQASDGYSSPDGGTTNLIKKFLVNVCEWDEDKILIGQLPDGLIEIVAPKGSYGDEADYNTRREKVKNLLGFSGYAAGVSSEDGAALLTTGAPISGLTAEQSANAWIVAGEAVARNMGKKGALIGIITALAESGLRNLNYGDRDSVGMFQQRPSQGWGTPAELVQPQISTKKFYDCFPQYAPNWKTDPEWISAQKIQRSGFADGSNYKAQMAKGQQIVDQMFTSVGAFSGSSTGTGTNPDNVTVPPSSGVWQHPCPKGTVTSGFGMRWGSMHRGLDLGAPSMTPIYAVDNGVVTHAGPASGFGYAVCLRHADGTGTGYGHMTQASITVKVGDTVKRGQQIASVGKEGQSTGYHLHFEVYAKGNKFADHVDPLPVLKAHGVPLDGSASSPSLGSTIGASQTGNTTNGAPPITQSTTVDVMKSTFGADDNAVKGSLKTVKFRGANIKVHTYAAPSLEKAEEQLASDKSGDAECTKDQKWEADQEGIVGTRELSDHAFGIAFDLQVKGANKDAALPDAWISALKTNGWNWAGDQVLVKNKNHFSWAGGAATTGDDAVDPSADSQAGALVQKLADAVFNLRFPMPGQADPVSDQLTGYLAPLNDVSANETIGSIVGAGMRNYMSAPDGRFVAYYPDYFGIFNKEAKVKISDIEVVDLNISKNDDNYASHVYGIGGTLSNGFESNGMQAADYLLQGQGSVATVFNKEIFKGLLGIDPDADPDYSAEALIKRFGIAPRVSHFPLIKDPALEYFYTLHDFMTMWASQYDSQVEIMFMPEVYPGMRVEISSQKVTMYVKGVEHTYSPQNGARTRLTVSAPTAKDGGLKGLPKDQG